MAKETDKNTPGIFGKLGTSARKWFSNNVEKVEDLGKDDPYAFDFGSATQSLLGTGRRAARMRTQIYQKWSFMEGDPIVSGALSLIVTSALGGHETTGNTVFIEKKADTIKNIKLAKMVDEIDAALTPKLNQMAHNMAYNGATFGDSYARPYVDSGGVQDMYFGEIVRPPMVQPYEKGNRMVGFLVYSGTKAIERLDTTQLLRLKMPRLVWVPQFAVQDKVIKMALSENDLDALPILPAMVGGSFLHQAEEAYDHLYASLIGLIGQRFADSIDERVLGFNGDGMTADQQKLFGERVKNMLIQAKQRAQWAIDHGQPIVEKFTTILPYHGEKQLVNLSQTVGNSGRNGELSIDDVMMHARLLGGALGVDLSMVGFADQLSGGLGDGGFFRVSAQVAEKSRVIRGALTDFFNSVIDLHTMHRYGIVFSETERPWNINFYGSISAMEAEKQRTRLESANSAGMLAQVMAQIREMGLDEKTAAMFLSRQMLLDEDEAAAYAAGMAKKPLEEGGDGSL
ncbi:hypothetical protein ACVBEF_05920 [Glaciimonas sp. GG7]